MFGRLEVQRLYDRVAELPTHNSGDAAAAKEHNYNDADNEGGIVLLGGIRSAWHVIHFVHNFFSPYDN